MTDTSKAFFVGRLTTDPSFAYNGNSKSSTFKIMNDKSSIFYDVLARGKQATICHTYLRKGILCCVEGHYDNSTKTIIADNVTFLSKVYKLR